MNAPSGAWFVDYRVRAIRKLAWLSSARIRPPLDFAPNFVFLFISHAAPGISCEISYYFAMSPPSVATWALMQCARRGARAGVPSVVSA